MCADKDYLGHFPSDMSAAEISELLTERCDLGLFVSMWACLWKDAIGDGEGGNQKAYDDACLFLSSGAYRRAAEGAFCRDGCWGVPALVLQECRRT